MNKSWIIQRMEEIKQQSLSWPYWMKRNLDGRLRPLLEDRCLCHEVKVPAGELCSQCGKRRPIKNLL